MLSNKCILYTKIIVLKQIYMFVVEFLHLKLLPYLKKYIKYQQLNMLLILYTILLDIVTTK